MKGCFGRNPMFLLLLRHVPRTSAWLAKQSVYLLYRNCNLQTLILIPLVAVLLLLPVIF